MKKLLALALSVTAAIAADINLKWNPSPSPGITNYALYASTASTNLIINVGTNLTASLVDVKPGIWTFYVTAGKDGLQSPPCTPLTVEMAQPPENLRTIIVQGAPIITATNWQDLGVFKLKIQ